jgi:hypothetical protein
MDLNEIRAAARERLDEVTELLAGHAKLVEEKAELEAILGLRQPSPEPPASPAQGRPNGETAPVQRRGRGETEATKAVRAAAYAFVARPEHMDSPVSTRKIMEHLEAHGIEVSGANKLTSLSALLSRDERFQANGRSGWTLREQNGVDEALGSDWGSAEAEAEAAAPAD